MNSNETKTSNKISIKDTTQMFGEALRTLMAEKNIKQADLAKQTGIPKSAMSGYYNGKVIPQQKNIELIATVLNVTPEFLLSNGDNSMYKVSIPGYEDLTAEGKIKVHTYVQDIIPKYKKEN